MLLLPYYNNYIEMFPSSIIASWRKHEQQELIEFPESEIKEVKVGELSSKAWKIVRI